MESIQEKTYEDVEWVRKRNELILELIHAEKSHLHDTSTSDSKIVDELLKIITTKMGGKA